MMFKNCTLSILTWRAPKTLENTLISLHPIKEFFSECYVICQEGDGMEIDISQRYGFKVFVTEANLGIQEGLATCAKIAATELVLIMENDCALIKPEIALNTLEECRAAFARNEVDVIKLGHIDGVLNSRYEKYWGAHMPPKKTLWGYLRPVEAKSCQSDAIHHVEFPANEISTIHPIGQYLYLTGSEHVGWTNRAFLIKRDFFLDKIIGFARENPAKGKVNGKPDLEKEINGFWNRSWWRKQKFKVGITRPGLFGHARFDRSVDDEKVTL